MLQARASNPSEFAFSEPFDERDGAIDAVFRSDNLAKPPRGFLHLRICRRLAQRGSETWDRQLSLRKRRRRNAQGLHLASPERLITHERDNNLRNSGPKRGSRCPRPAMMHHCRDTWKQHVVRRGWDLENALW